VVFQAHVAAERLGGAFARQDAWEPLPEIPATSPAVELPRLQRQYYMPSSPALVPQNADSSPLLSQLRSATVWAGYCPLIAGCDENLSRFFFYPCNLISRQA